MIIVFGNNNEIEKILSSGALPKNLTGTLKEAREAVENGREEENLSVVERQSNVSGINMYD